MEFPLVKDEGEYMTGDVDGIRLWALVLCLFDLRFYVPVNNYGHVQTVI